MSGKAFSIQDLDSLTTDCSFKIASLIATPLLALTVGLWLLGPEVGSLQRTREMEPGSQGPPLEVLVVDSGAIIRGHGTNFHKRALRFVTVQEVLSEVRDSKARELLGALPFELEIRSPTEEAMAAVAQFARKSGDFAALSLTDIKLIAMTYSIEKELTGGARIRTEPPQRLQPMVKSSGGGGGGGKTKAVREDVGTGGDGFGDGIIHTLDAKCDCGGPHDPATGDQAEAGDGEAEDEDDEHDANTEEGGEEAVMEGGVVDEKDEEEAEEEELTHLNEIEFPALGLGGTRETEEIKSAFSWASVAKTGANEQWNLSPKKKTDAPLLVKRTTDEAKDQVLTVPGSASKEAGKGANALEQMPSRILSGSTQGQSALASARAAEEDDGQGWVNESNFRTAIDTGDCFRLETKSSKKAAKAKSEPEPEPAVVACITTDFSMQNVMMQMGLSVVSVDGMIVKSVKQWVLRCMACFQVHYEMDRLFCERCGVNHLSRVSCSIDAESGQLKLHLKKNYQPNTRGKIYSLPKPGQQGRYEGEILLREDQLSAGIWKQKKMAVQRNLKSAFGEDVTSDVGLHVNKGVRIKVGLGSRNPNAEKGRERRGKPKR